MAWKLSDLTRYTANTDVKIDERKNRYTGFMSLDTVSLTFRRFAGDWSAKMQREVLVREAAAGVLIWDPQRDEVLLVEQFRIGALSDQRSPWCLEVVAGIADVAGESLQELLRREALEEANVSIAHLLTLPSYFVSPGGTDEKMHLFLGVADLSQAGGVHGLASEHEDIRSHRVPVSMLPELLEQGVLNNAASLIAVQWFLLHAAELKQQYL